MITGVDEEITTAAIDPTDPTGFVERNQELESPDSMDVENKISDPESSCDGLSGDYTWRLEGWTKQTKTKQYSPTFKIAGYNWRILLFPSGNNVPQLSIYLDVADSAVLPHGWTRQASFALTAVNQRNPQMNVTKEASHQFCSRACDWGFREFLPLAELRDPRQGFVIDDVLVITAHVQVQQPVNLWKYPFMFVHLNFAVAATACPISVSLVHGRRFGTLSFTHDQLGFQKGDRICGLEESRSHLLYEFATSDTLPHSLFS